MNAARSENFAEGMIVDFPESAQNIRVRKVAGKRLEDFPGKADDDFTPHRLVIVFDLYDEDNPDATSGDLSQPVTVRIRYTPQDVASAGGLDKLRLGYYKDGQWKRFSSKKDKFTLESDTGNPNQGNGVVEFTRWGDPPMGWGN